jgi:hypothetical protein
MLLHTIASLQKTKKLQNEKWGNGNKLVKNTNSFRQSICVISRWTLVIEHSSQKQAECIRKGCRGMVWRKYEPQNRSTTES